MRKNNVLHIFGASGAGVSTLGKAICDRYGYFHCDVDDYFWLPTDPPFTTKREVPLRLQMLEEAIAEHQRCVLSGSLVEWGDPLIPHFDLAVYVHTPSEVRLKRLEQREYQRFGERIRFGGDMEEEHKRFLAWAAEYDDGGMEVRSALLHREWSKQLPCPVISVDGTLSAQELLRQLPLEQ